MKILDKEINPDDLLEINWQDTHDADRITLDEINSLDNPLATISYGKCIKIVKDYIMIASDISLTKNGAGYRIEQIFIPSITWIGILIPIEDS